MTATAYVTTDHAEIPGLPPQLRVVPDERVQWEKWRDAVIAYRDLIWKQCEADEEARTMVRALCADDPAYFLAVFGFIWEPRRYKGRTAGKIPFAPFPKQVGVIRHFMERQQDEEAPDGYYPKSRGFGLTVTICGIAVWGWLYEDVWDVGLSSRDASYVDGVGFKKALFWKCDYYLNNLPSWMLPDGFTTKRGTEFRADMKITNPHNGNSITGEASTPDLFRGDRKTWIYIDEATSYKDFGPAMDSITGTTDHRYTGSTEKGRSEFNRMWTFAQGENPHSVYETYWWDNLYFDQEWYRKERARFESAGRLAYFRQEYERDPDAGQGERVYPMAQDRRTGVFPYEPRAGQVYVCIDPGIRDATAIHWFQFHAATGRYRLVESYENAGKTAAFYGSILTGIPVSGPEGFGYDESDFAAMDFAKSITDPIVYVGDPYGRNRGADGRSTFYETLADEAKRLSGGRVFIYVLTSYAPDDRSYTGRRDALATMLPMIDFNDTPQVRISLQAIKEQSYKTMNATREVVNPTADPVHGWGSHRTTSAEYLAVHLHGGRDAAKKRDGSKTKRQGLGGKPLGNRGGGLTRTPAWSMGRAR